MTPPAPPPFDRRIAVFEAELAALRAYPRDRLAAIVAEIGFSCDGCARCCTRQSNDHVFLLEEDVDRLREIGAGDARAGAGPGARGPGGPALRLGVRARDDGGAATASSSRRAGAVATSPGPPSAGSTRTCSTASPARTAGSTGGSSPGLGTHGEYGAAIAPEEAGRIADETIAYEAAFLEQMLGFYRTAAAHFAANDLRHVQKVRDDRLRAHARGEPLELLVYHRGRFEPRRLEPSQR